jgi:uncharacterized protein YjiS (DUF1127 family)
MGTILQCSEMAPRLAVGGVGSRISEWMVGVADVLQTWRERARQRRHLAALDDRMLRDIGASAADVERETRKRFWQR